MRVCSGTWAISGHVFGTWWGEPDQKFQEAVRAKATSMQKKEDKRAGHGAEMAESMIMRAAAAEFGLGAEALRLIENSKNETGKLPKRAKNDIPPGHQRKRPKQYAQYPGGQPTKKTQHQNPHAPGKGKGKGKVKGKGSYQKGQQKGKGK